MGRVDVAMQIANPDARDRAEELTLMADTGATFTVVPRDVWDRLGLIAEFPGKLLTASGEILERQQGEAYVEIDGHAGNVPVVQASDGDYPVLGVTTVEILGLVVDPVRKVLAPFDQLYL